MQQLTAPVESSKLVVTAHFMTSVLHHLITKQRIFNNNILLKFFELFILSVIATEILCTFIAPRLSYERKKMVKLI